MTDWIVEQAERYSEKDVEQAGDWDIWESEDECPVCKSKDYVPAYGNKKSKVLLVAEFPGEDEVRKGVPMTGNMSNVLRTELAILGQDLKAFRRMNVWFHPPNKNPKCFEYGVEQVIKEAKGKSIILLMGDEVVKYFCNESVTKVCGLQVTSPYLSAPHIFACINPAQVYHLGHGVGEIRLALHKFVKEVENNG